MKKIRGIGVSEPRRGTARVKVGKLTKPQEQFLRCHGSSEDCQTYVVHEANQRRVARNLERKGVLCIWSTDPDTRKFGVLLTFKGLNIVRGLKSLRA